MGEFDPNQTTTPTNLTDYSVEDQSTDGVQVGKETFWYNSNFTKWYGNYNTIAKIKVAIKAYATWIVGKGWTSPQEDVLKNIRGWGEDTFTAILWNMLVVKKINGDSYAEIVRDNGIIINIKPLDPACVSFDCIPTCEVFFN